MAAPSEGDRQRSVNVRPLAVALNARGLLGGVRSSVKLCVDDQSELLPASSSARTRQKYEPSSRLPAVQLAVLPMALRVATSALAATRPDVPPATTVVQAASEHTWNASRPSSLASSLRKVPVSRAVLTSAPLSGAGVAGTLGATLSTTNCPIADHADWLPTRSSANPRQ